MTDSSPDFLVIGGGIIGLSVARELRRRHPGARVVLIEKEAEIGLHASGRNSGVLHAGFYYDADSLKARFCREGNRELAAYCGERGLPLRRCGKLVVARSEAEVPVLDGLLERARTNGVRLEDVSEEDARKIEPRARTTGRALFSPDTASIDPARLLGSIAQDARREGVEVRLGVAYRRRLRRGVLRITGGDLSAGYVVNCAGLFADRVARDFGFCADHRILPFKGLYLESSPSAPPLSVHVYPVPLAGNAFLGVHLTVTADGHTKVGPNALPALWREQYGILRGFRAGEFVDVARRELSLMFRSGFEFRRLALDELRKSRKGEMVRRAGEIVSGIRAEDYPRWGRPGIRAQLVNIRTHALEMDFRLEGDERSLHVLNVVSPGLTCAMPFARHICDRIGHAAHSQAPA